MANKQGVTLIELMIVVVIISILAAIAIPNFLDLQDRAKEAKVKNNAHVVQLAAEDFAIINSGIYSDTGANLVPMLPGQANVENAFTRLRSEPQFAAPAATPGQIGIVAIVDPTGTNVGYRITGMGKNPADGFIIDLSNGI